MSLQTVPLDTLDWDQMVTAIRTRIVPDSRGKWTLHAPVDPGITLLELFAWLLDQRIYWLAQTPDALMLAVLSLLGFEPLGAQAAVSVFQLQDSAIPPRSLPVAPAGMLLELQNSDPPILFTLYNGVSVLPLATGVMPGLVVNGVDRSQDLQQGRAVALLATGSTSSEVVITLNLSAPLANVPAGQSFSVMLEFDVPADFPPQWMASAVDGIAAAATLSWSYATTHGGTGSLAAAATTDGTAGLRRSGIVRLPLPQDWQAQPAVAGAATTAYQLVLQIENATFTSPPRLLAVQFNAALGHHSWPRSKAAATAGWRPLPGNVISLSAAASDSNLIEYPPLESTVQLQVTEQGQAAVAWQWVDDFSFAGPQDRVFAIDRVHSQISFGNGLNGHLPVVDPTVASSISVSYAAGGGLDGNVGQGRMWAAQPGRTADPSPLFTAINLAAGDGGADSEALPAALQRAAAGLDERNRAISKGDYENLVISTPGVALRRAYAAVGFNAAFPCGAIPGFVTIFAVPYAPRFQTDGQGAAEAFVAAPQPDPGALQAAQARLDAGRLIGGQVVVVGPAYRPVWLDVLVAISAPLPTSVRQAVISALQAFLDPLVGGAGSSGWPFGDPLRPSALLEVAQDALGDGGDVQSVGIQVTGMTAAERCKDVPIKAYELPVLKHVDIRTQPRAVTAGGLR
jgi:hypothetical protein